MLWPCTVKHDGGAIGRFFTRSCYTLEYIALFLQEDDFSPAGRGKILGILGDPQKKILLQIELAVLVDVGKQFVQATYSLEGDSPLVFSYLKFFLR